VTQLLAAARAGDGTASNRLFELVYDDLRHIAGRHLRGAGQASPSTTSVVHEAFLRFARRDQLPFDDRVHFFAVVSTAMRQIVIDLARRRLATKRGAGLVDDGFDPAAFAVPATEAPAEELLSVHEALQTLEAREPRLARTVEWHFFGGLTFPEIAEATGVSERTVQRDWRTARALLHAHLESGLR
jgi:RNA polymerase sigma factor (TIGR02999 family)